MLHAIFGPPRSGKSGFAEGLGAGLDGSSTYVGTLPNSRYYATTIAEHQARRPPAWGLIEMTYRPAADIACLDAALEEYHNILLDGPSHYVLRFLALSRQNVVCYSLRYASFLRRAAVADRNVVIVDALVPRGLPVGQRCVLLGGHALLLRCACRVTLFGNGVPLSTSKGAVAMADVWGRIRHCSVGAEETTRPH